MLFFVCTDFTCHTHPFGQLLNKIVVAFVYLLAQFAEVLGALCFLADDQQVEDVIQHIRGDLLGCIAPGTVRVAVALDNQSVETQIHSLLAEWSNQFALSTYVAGVTDNRKVGNSAAQLNGDMPLGQVTVELFVIAAKSAVDGTQAFQACIVETFQSSNPQLQVRIYRVLYQYRNIHTFQRIGNFLHGKRVGGGACAYPKQVYPGLQAFVYVFGCSDFGRNVHAGFFLYLLQPCKAVYAYSFEAARFGARFPDAGTE